MEGVEGKGEGGRHVPRKVPRDILLSIVRSGLDPKSEIRWPIYMEYDIR